MSTAATPATPVAPASAPRWRDAAAVAVENRMFRALGVLRIILLINAVALNVVRRDNAQSPAGLWICVG